MGGLEGEVIGLCVGFWLRLRRLPYEVMKGSEGSMKDMPVGRAVKAVVAVAHEMLRIVYYMLKRNEPYRGERRGLSVRKFKRLERKALFGLQV